MNFLKRFFKVYLQPKTYLYLIYLILAFPLGLTYFILLVTGFSTGFALTLLIIGVFILFATLAMARFFIFIERKMAHWLLQMPVIKNQSIDIDHLNSPWFKKMTGFIRHPQTWIGLLYLLLKFPIGIVTFSITVILMAVSFSLLASPISYHLWENHYWGPGILFWKIDTTIESWFGFLLGFIILTISLNITNFLGSLLGTLTNWLLNPHPNQENPQE